MSDNQDWSDLPKLEALLRAQGPLPQRLQPSHYYMLIQRDCPHCRDLLTRNNFARRTEGGRDITYIDLRTPEGVGFVERNFTDLQELPGRPALLETDAQGKLRVVITQPTPIMQQLFPRAFAAEPSRTNSRQEEAAEDVGTVRTTPQAVTTAAAPQTPPTVLSTVADASATTSKVQAAVQPLPTVAQLAGQPPSADQLTRWELQSLIMRAYLNDGQRTAVQNAVASFNGTANFQVNDLEQLQTGTADITKLRQIADTLRAAQVGTAEPVPNNEAPTSAQTGIATQFNSVGPGIGS